MAAGPSIAGIVMTAVMEGRAGLRELLARVAAKALLAPVAASPAQHLLWYAIFAAALWALALIVARDRRKALPDAASGTADERAA